MKDSEKLDQILSKVGNIEQYLAGNDVHIDILQKTTDSHSTKIETLEKNQYKAIGGLSVLGVIGTALFSWIFKQ